MPAVTPASDDDLRQWLLQRLPPARAAALEQQLMHDDSLLDRLREAESDLLDDAAQGRLDAAEAKAFRRHRLGDAAQRERLRFARAFAQLGEGAATQNPTQYGARVAPASARREALPGRRRVSAWFGLAAAACAIVAVLATLGWNLLVPAPPSAPIATYTLLASTQRGSGPPPLRLPAAGTAVRLQLEVTDSTRRYRLVLETQGQTRPIAGDLRPQSLRAYTYVEATVDAALLTAGSHRLLLFDGSAGSEPEQAWVVQVGEP